MEWIQRLNETIDYIEENLTKEIECEKLAKIAGCSVYHFQRMFSYIAGVPLSEYIRRRRMTKAAVELQTGNEKILDIALKYGYDSPTAFNRAFRSIHGITPSQAKVNGASIKAFPPISFKITIKGVEEMNYRIEKKEAFRIIGISEKLDTNMEKNFKTVPKLWQRAAAEGALPKLIKMMDSNFKGVLGVSACAEPENWKYFIAVANESDSDEQFEEYLVPELTWAIFSGKGTMPAGIQELEQRIMTEWLPTSGYEYANGPDIELYFSPDPKNAEFEVWIPVVKTID